MYFGRDPSNHSTLYFSSEMKSIVHCSQSELMLFPPGHYYSSAEGHFVQYYHPQWDLPLFQDFRQPDEIFKILSDSVQKVFYFCSMSVYGSLLIILTH